MGSNNPRQQTPTDEAVRYVLDKLMQDLATTLLPILRKGNKVRIIGDQSGSPGDPVKLQITEYVN